MKCVYLFGHVSKHVRGKADRRDRETLAPRTALLDYPLVALSCPLTFLQQPLLPRPVRVQRHAQRAQHGAGDRGADAQPQHGKACEGLLLLLLLLPAVLFPLFFVIGVVRVFGGGRRGGGLGGGVLEGPRLLGGLGGRGGGGGGGWGCGGLGRGGVDVACGVDDDLGGAGRRHGVGVGEALAVCFLLWEGMVR